MNVLKIAAFSDGNAGGNPAGVVLSDRLASSQVMQRYARDVGFSETAFAAPDERVGRWRVRYFSPETEVPFCGHATIALGAALAEKQGAGKFDLTLNDADISVTGSPAGEGFAASLQSPPTKSVQLSSGDIDAALALFGYHANQLDGKIPPAFIHAGANHHVLALKSREDLAAMNYQLDAGRNFMLERDLVTVMLVHCQSDQAFHVRNAFASGGVLEDPATGAAAAAFAGYLRDINWPHGGQIELVQGEDMGSRSLIAAQFSSEPGSSVQISGTARWIS